MAKYKLVAVKPNETCKCPHCGKEHQAPKKEERKMIYCECGKRFEMNCWDPG